MFLASNLTANNFLVSANVFLFELSNKSDASIPRKNRIYQRATICLQNEVNMLLRQGIIPKEVARPRWPVKVQGYSLAWREEYFDVQQYFR